MAKRKSPAGEFGESKKEDDYGNSLLYEVQKEGRDKEPKTNYS